MKAESGIRPPAYAVNFDGDEAVIRLAENVVEKSVSETEEEQDTVFEYDSYELRVRNRKGLENDIASDTALWIEKAKQQERDKLASDIREKRNKLLSETDSEFCIDRIDLTNLKSLADSPMAKYRQALRDIPEQEGFPYNVKYPEKPNN